ncbi:MAG: hypothetical protein R3F20_15140 [Planctomycetota bacterium]
MTTGRIDEFVDGFAVMTIVDLAVQNCKQDGFECADPKARADGTVTVEFRDESGAPLRFGLKGRSGIGWLGIVTVKGKISRDSRGNATVVADKIYVHPES